MGALAIMAATQGAIGVGQTVYGAIGSAKVNRERNEMLNNSPQYQIPPELLQNMTESEMMAYQGLPEAQKQEYLDNIRRSAQFATAASSSRSGSMMALPMIQQSLNDSFRNLMTQDAAARMNNINAAQRARTVIASEKAKQFDINEMQPYNNRLSVATDQLSYMRSIMGQGMQNMFGGATSLAGQQSDNQPSNSAMITSRNNTATQNSNAMAQEQGRIESMNVMSGINNEFRDNFLSNEFRNNFLTPAFGTIQNR